MAVFYHHPRKKLLVACGPPYRAQPWNLLIELNSLKLSNISIDIITFLEEIT